MEKSNPSDGDARAQALVETLTRRHPERFSDADVSKLREQVKVTLDAVARLRAYTLSNADEPMPVFRAFPPEG